MKLIHISLSAGIIFSLFSSCTNKKAESTLLSDKQSCSIEDCPSPQSKITGNLSIESDAGSYQLNVDKSDVIEIAGKCSDLGLRNNRILVELYEGENVSLPNALIMENSSSLNCTMNTSTPSLNGQRCFWVTNGHGVVDSGTEYPQCFNGRFAFSVKLGRILRMSDVDNAYPKAVDDTTNPKRKYMVRFKLRANNGAISESVWNSTLIERGVTKPTFNMVTKAATPYKCDVKINAFKNLTSLTNITYEIKMTPQYIGPINGTLVDITPPGSPISYIEPIPALPVTHVTNYSIDNLIPGVGYSMKIKAFDQKYSYSLPTPGTPEESPFSDEVKCLNPPDRPILNITGGADATLGTTYTGGITSTCSSSLKSCTVTLDFPAILTGSLEWVVMKGKTSFEENFEPATPLPACGSYGTSTVEGCTFTTSTTSLSYTFKPEFYPKNTCTGNGVGTNSYNTSYGIAVRYVNSSTEKGKWSSSALQPVVCTWSQ